MAFAPQFLDEIRQRLSLASVVGRRVKLTKRGRDYVGLCPFHKEKTPSFNVVEEKAFYHCFGCGAHGDVVGFMMRVENLGFRESVEQLARQAGLELPVESPAVRAEAERTLTLHEVCASAADTFERQLWSTSGAHGLAYLRRRGLPDELIRKFRLGWAPDSRNFLKNALGGRFPEALLVEAGLLRQGEGDSFDFFRNRVIFPIFDRSGRVVAFGGRTMGDAQPKYLNSPETPIFHKGRSLYALNIARSAFSAENQPIVVEGYMDVITLHSAGFTTGVAPLGTALTEEQLSELWRHADQPIVCFDGDKAGFRAAVRALDRSLPVIRPSKTLFFVELPHGEDPDSLVRTQGADKFRECVRGGRPLSEFLWSVVIQNQVPRTAERLARVREELEHRVSQIVDRNVQKSFRTILFGRLWEIFRHGRRGRLLKRDEQIMASDLVGAINAINAALSRNRVKMLLMAMAINHPKLLLYDVDRFSHLKPETEEMADLHQRIIQAVAEDADVDPGVLSDTLWKRRQSEVEVLFQSRLYRATLTAHPHAGEAEAKLGWEALFNRLDVYEMKQQFEDARRRAEENLTEESFRMQELRRAAYVAHDREEHLVEQPREAIPIRKAWQPPRRTGPDCQEGTVEFESEPAA